MARSPLFKAGVIAVVLALATILLVLTSLRSAYAERCEVCMEFLGRAQCRTAYGTTQAEAIRTATDNACALIASGMTDTIRCSSAPPVRTTCDE